MANKHQVLAAFAANPKASSAELAADLGCNPAYVRATITRAGLKLYNSQYGEGVLKVLRGREAIAERRIKNIRKQMEILQAALDASEAKLRRVQLEIKSRFNFRRAA